MKQKIQSKILSIQNITESTFILRLERNGFEFRAGQYLVLSVPGERKAREYSIYSGENDECIELLIKEVNPGDFSKEIKHIKVGSKVEISGPYGFFIVKDEVLQKKQPIVFVASGTGIAPFHSIVASNPDHPYKVLLGVRFGREACGREDFNANNFQLCVSRELDTGFHGRVTDFIKQSKIDRKALYYLCGNSAMVNEVTEYLEEQGLPLDQIKTEVFF